MDMSKFRMLSPFYKPNGMKNLNDIFKEQAINEFELYQESSPNSFDVQIFGETDIFKGTMQDVTDLEVRSDTKILLTSVRSKKVNNGDVLLIDNMKWLCIYDKFKTTQNCYKVKIQPCNFVIKIPFYSLVDKSPMIYDAPVVINPYLADVRDDKQTMPIDSTIMYVNIRYDEYTKNLKQQDRLYIYGKCWQIAGIDMTNVRFPAEKGCMQFTMRPVLQSDDLDNFTLGICDYYKFFSKPVTPTPIVPPPITPPTESIVLSAPKDCINTFGTLQITATTTPLNSKVTFMFEGAQNKCKFINVTDNTCTVKADSDVGYITVKAFLQSNATVIATKRITIKSDW